MRRNKYGAKKTSANGRIFDSKLEARRAVELQQQQAAGHLQDLEYQIPFPLVVEGCTVGTYVADFRYTCRPSGEIVVEDAKGMRTPVYNLKKKLVRALYGFDIQEWPLNRRVR